MPGLGTACAWARLGDLARRWASRSADGRPLGITGGGDTARSPVCAALAPVDGRVEQHRQICAPDRGR